MASLTSALLHAVALLQLAAVAGATLAPNTSLATVPTAYFGGNFAARADANIEMLAKMRIVMIEKWEGPCWQKCLQAGPGSPDCSASCGVENYILDTFRQVKAVNPSVATVLYWNTLLAFPFYTAVGKFAAADALTIDSSTGKPISIRNDNGMEDIGVYGFDTEKGVQLYIDTVKNLTSIDGLVDGFFGDKWDSGAQQGKGGQWQICNHECGNVTAAQAKAWNSGKAKALAAVTNYVGDGPYFSNGDSFMGVRANLNGHWNSDKDLHKGDPRDLITDVAAHLVNHTYFYMSCTGDQHWTVDPNDPSSLTSACDDKVLARFLLGVEKGCFLGTNGWDAAYERELGDPLGPAVYTPGRGKQPATMHRNFTSGTYVIFTYNKKGDDGEGEVWWGGKPPPPPPGIECNGVASTLLQGVTFAYNDIAKPTVVENATSCCAECARDLKCIEWAFHEADDKSCHLHGPKSAAKNKAGVVSGVMKRS